MTTVPFDRGRNPAKRPPAPAGGASGPRLSELDDLVRENLDLLYRLQGHELFADPSFDALRLHVQLLTLLNEATVSPAQPSQAA